MDILTDEGTAGAENVQTSDVDDKYVPDRSVELELNLHHMMELAGMFGVVINNIVKDPV